MWGSDQSDLIVEEAPNKGSGSFEDSGLVGEGIGGGLGAEGSSQLNPVQRVSLRVPLPTP